MLTVVLVAATAMLMDRMEAKTQDNELACHVMGTTSGVCMRFCCASSIWEQKP